jgi:septin family protein
MDINDLIKLKTALPKNHLVELHKITKYSKTYIWQVLAGERENDQIIDAAIELAKENKEKIESRKSELANL